MKSVGRRRDCCYDKAEISYSTSTVDSLTRQTVDGIEMKAVFKKGRSSMKEPKSSACYVKNNASTEGTYGLGDDHVPFML